MPVWRVDDSKSAALALAVLLLAAAFPPFDLRSFNEGLMDINKALSLVPQNRNNEKADILGLRGLAKASKALVERPYDLKLVLADAVKDLDEAYSLYPRPLFIERKNEILSELNK